jgi:hypothetical protein
MSDRSTNAEWSGLDAQGCQACERNGWTKNGIYGRRVVVGDRRAEDGDDVSDRRLRRLEDPLQSGNQG